MHQTVDEWQFHADTLRFARTRVFVNIALRTNISKTVGDKDSVAMEHIQEMAYGESNDHVIDDVT